MPSMKDAALMYAKRGWPVFPVRSDKNPYTEHGVLEATTDSKQIEQWWEEFPRANVAMDVGGAGMVAVDLDPGHSIEQLEQAIGSTETDLVQRTPRGGYHLFFAKANDELIPPSGSKIAEHVDVRSHHSYVLLAPSKTPDGSYSWESEGKPAYRSDALVEAASAARERSSDHDTWIIEPDLPENVEAAVKYLRHDAQIAIESMNGDTMAYRTAAMMKSYGLSPEMAFDMMWQHWNPRCEPPWDSDEVEHLETKVLNAYEYNTSPPGNMTQAYKVAKHQQLFKPVLRDTSEEGKEAQAGRFRFVDEHGVDDIKPPEWLINDTLPQRAYATLIGPRSAYKSFVALDMAMSIATGGSDWYDERSDWRGTWPDVTVKGPVLYAAGEGRAGFRSRVRAWRSYHLEEDYSDNFYLVDPVPHPTEEDVTAFIQGALSLNDGYELVVLDTVGRSMQGLNENSQQDVSRFTQMVETIQYELDCAVLAIHHTGHEAKDRARGSSVFGADVDVELVAERYDEGYVRVSNTKQKDAPEWEEAKLIKLEAHEGSLVAVATKQDKVVHKTDSSVGRKEKGKGGRKARADMAIEMSVIRKAAYQTMKKYPGKEWSKSALAQAIAAHDTVEVAAGTVRNKYLDELLTDKTHPVASCFDPGKGVWMYQP